MSDRFDALYAGALLGGLGRGILYAVLGQYSKAYMSDKRMTLPVVSTQPDWKRKT